MGRRQAQPVSEGACLETLTRATSDVGYTDAFAPPVRRAPADDGECLVVRIVEDLDVQPLEWPLHRTHRIDDPLGDVTLVVDRDLHAHVRLCTKRDRCALGRPEARGAPGQIEQVRPKAQKRKAAGGENTKRHRRDHVASTSSNSEYGCMVARTYATRASASGLPRRVHCM